MNKLTLTVEGMTCHHCEMTIEKAVKQLKNVVSANADHMNKTLEIIYTGELKIDDVKQKVEEVGYKVLV
ncbi:copper chaperone [Candidatus Kryptonium thompsonii]|nr:copper chaperone [Candidatus Kryptonium thompsoni]